ncbi:MAG TPA: WecB/TagA/CpsF family glycosyltransferase [Symbiobacteriaceae bacterium]
MSRARVLALEVDKVTMQEALERCLAFVDGEQPRLVVTPNAEIAYAALQDPELAAILNGADLVVPDGAGVVLASRILGDPVPEKVGGVDLATNLVAALSEQGRGRIYLLGARPEVVAEAARRLAERYPGITVAGYRDGYFSPAEEADVVAAIRAARADVLFVGMGSPKQERFLSRNLDRLNVKIGMGVGGTLDVWAGAARRAPDWMIRANLEWLYRIVKFGRYGRSLPPLFKFMLAVLVTRVRGR